MRQQLICYLGQSSKVVSKKNPVIVLFLFRDPACNSQPVPGLLGPALLRGVAVLLQQPAGHPPHAGVRGLH